MFTRFSRQPALSNTAVGLRGAPVGGTHSLYYVFVHNPDTTNPVWLQLFDEVVGSTVLGTTVPTISLSISAGFCGIVPLYHQFVNGVTVAATGLATGANAPSSALRCHFALG